MHHSIEFEQTKNEKNELDQPFKNLGNRNVDRSIHRSMAVGLISYLDGYCKDSNSNSGNSRPIDSSETNNKG